MPRWVPVAVVISRLLRSSSTRPSVRRPSPPGPGRRRAGVLGQLATLERDVVLAAASHRSICLGDVRHVAAGPRCKRGLSVARAQRSGRREYTPGTLVRILDHGQRHQARTGGRDTARGQQAVGPVGLVAASPGVRGRARAGAQPGPVVRPPRRLRPGAAPPGRAAPADAGAGWGRCRSRRAESGAARMPAGWPRGRPSSGRAPRGAAHLVASRASPTRPPCRAGRPAPLADPALDPVGPPPPPLAGAAAGDGRPGPRPRPSCPKIGAAKADSRGPAACRWSPGRARRSPPSSIRAGSRRSGCPPVG